MKVTVCFGGTGVVVPCGSGHLLIGDLIEAAIHRYKKATGKPNESWVTVHSLKSMSGGGILDPDDQLIAVVDDKEQILAIYEEQDSTPPPIPYSYGEATTSSVGTNSPDIHRPPPVPHHSYSAKPAVVVVDEEPLCPSPATFPSGGTVDNSVEITSLEDPPSSGLMVRNGEEGNTGTATTTSDEKKVSEGRGSGRERPDSKKSPGSNRWKKRPAPPPPPPAPALSVSSEENDEEGKGSPPSKSLVGSFLRTGAPRQSSVGDKWLLAQEHAEERFHQTREVSVDGDPGLRRSEIEIEIGGLPGEPLGIQVSPAYGDNGRLSGVVVTQIHENSRAHDDGLLKLNDKITEINGRPIYQMSFVRAQSYLHEISQQSPVTFQVVRSGGTEEEEKKWRAPSVPGKGPQSALQKANTKKLGQKMAVDLKKGNQGLGFTVTSRDTAVEGERPFYIKTVLPRGAAIIDGRLSAGDRLLQVNEREITGMTQRGVVDLLRDFKQGDVVTLVISRVGDSGTPAEESPPPPPVPSAPSAPSPALPRHLPPEMARVEGLESERKKEMKTLHIPLNATGSAGLGVSVKGRLVTTQQGHQEDSGIYIKGIIHGGAAHKDGRLRRNDQLVGIEDANLLGLSNAVAMQMIGQTMQNLSSEATSIKLTVLRVVRESQPPSDPGSPDGGESVYLDAERSEQPRYTIPGYGDYALIVKGARDPQTTLIIQDNEEQIVTPTPAKWNPVYEEVESLSEGDAFKREAPGRRSMSEKRHGGGKADPSHTKTFQRIKEAKNHQRQHSAPALQDIELMSGGTEAHLKEEDRGEQRRSMSLESLSRLPCNGKVVGTQQPMIHELVSRSIPPPPPLHKEKKHGKIPNPLKKVQRLRPTNESFRQAVDRSYQSMPGAEVGVDVGEFSEGDEEGNGHTQSLPRPNKDKERRKSTGSGLIMEWFGRQFGSSRSREASMEKRGAENRDGDAQEIAKRAAEEEQRKYYITRIRVQYEKLKRQHQEMENRQMPSPKIPSRWRPPPSSKSTSHLPERSHPGPPPPYHGLRRNYPPPPPPPPYRGDDGRGRPRAPTHSFFDWDRINVCPSQYQDSNNVPAWFAVAAEHRKFYRSLDRPSPGSGSGRRGGREKASTMQAKNGRDTTSQYSTPGGPLRGVINEEQDLTRAAPKSQTSRTPENRPPLPLHLPLTKIPPERNLPNYDHYLRHSQEVKRGRRPRPASNFCDYKSSGRGGVFKGAFGSPVPEAEPAPDYSPLDERNGFIIKM